MHSFLFTLPLALFSATSSAASVRRSWDTRSVVPASAPVERDLGPRRAFGVRTYNAESSPLRRHAVTLRPINARTFDSAVGLHARSTLDYASMKPSSQAQMFYGGPGGQGQMQLANMTLYAADDLPVIMLERFDGLTSAVDCKGDDGEMSLTFRSPEAYASAAETWSYINDGPDKQFLMIANHEGCGPDSERKPYKVTGITMDASTRTTHLAAQPAAWKEVAGAFDMDFGKAALSTATLSRLERRGFLDFIGDAFEGIKDGFDAIVNGNGNFSKTIDFPVQAGTPGEETLLFEDFTRNPPRVKLTCVDCFVEGSFQATGNLAVQDFTPQTVRLDVAPKDVQAVLKMKLEIAQRTDDSELTSFEKTLVEAAIPGAGINIPEIFTLGAKVQLNVQAKALLIGQATMFVGAKATMPNTAVATLDLINPENSGTTGFEDFTFEPILDLGSADLTVNFLAGPQPALVLGAEILDNGVEAKVTFGTPTLNLNATGGFDQNGFCTPGDAVTSGFKVQSAANFDVSLNVNAEVAGDKTDLFDRKLVNIPLATFLDECFPVDGLTPINQSPPNGTKFLA